MRQPRVAWNEDSVTEGGREAGSDKPAKPMPATGCPGGRPPFPGRSSALSWTGDPGHTWLGRLPPPSVLMGAKAQVPQLCTCCGLSALCQRGGLGYCPDQPPCRTVFTPTSAHTRSGSDNAEAMSASGRVGRAPAPICSLTRGFPAGNLCSRAHGKPSHSRSGGLDQGLEVSRGDSCFQLLFCYCDCKGILFPSLLCDRVSIVVMNAWIAESIGHTATLLQSLLLFPNTCCFSQREDYTSLLCG